MKRLIHATRSLLALLFLLIGGVNAASAQTEVTFDFTTADGLSALGLPTTHQSEIGEEAYTMGAVSMLNADYGTSSSKVWASGSSFYLRIYAGSTLTFSVPDGTISNIVCTFTSSSYGADKFVVDTGDWTGEKSTTGTWTGSASSVTFTVDGTSGHARLSKVVVTYTSSGLSVPGYYFSETSFSVIQGSEFTAPELVNPNNVAVTYASSLPSVATVDAATGAVTIVGAGETTVTASSEESAEYLAGEASYTLRVVNSADMIVYRKVTSQDEIHDGGIYLVVDATDTYAMGELSSNGDYRPQVSISDNLADGAIKVISANETGTPYEVTLSEVSGSENTFGMQLANGNYLFKTGSKNTLNESADGPDASDNAQWTITYGAEAVSIRNVGATEYYIQHNAPNTRFSCYKNTMADVVLYRRVGELTIPTDEGYGTFYTDKAYIMPAGVRGTAVTDVTDGRLATAWEFAEGAEVPARTPLLLNGPKGTHTYIVLGATQATAPSVNYLRGSVEAETTTGADVYYKLTYNSTGDTRTLGFYWGAENGAAFTNAAGKAYLALPAALAAQLKGFAFAGGEATAITQVAQDPDASAAVYTLSGVRMPAGLSALPKGVYIVNGKKVMK